MAFELNGNLITWKCYEQNKRCVCGHIKLGHVHYNGGLGIPDCVPTYCGFDQCDCDRFEEQTTDRLITHLVNKLARLDMKYTLTSADHDDFLQSIQNLDEFIKKEFENLQREYKLALDEKDIQFSKNIGDICL